MTKIAFVADVHAANHARFGGVVKSGINRRCKLVLDAVADAACAATAAKCQAFVVLGDLFDTMRPEPQVITAMREALSFFDGPVYLLVGNHDQESTAVGDHALGPLVSEDITVIESPTVVPVRDVSLALVPFRPGPAVEWLAGAVPKISPATKHAVLAIHLGLSDDKTAPWLSGAPDSIPVSELTGIARGFDAVVAGNWHTRRSWIGPSVERGHTRTHVMQVGTLCPTGFDNPGPENYGTLAFYDSEKVGKVGDGLSWQEIPGPRFVSRDEVGKCIAKSTVFVRLRAAPEDTPAAMAWLAEAKESGAVADGTVEPDKAEAVAAARSAAGAARTATSLDEAVTRFVGAMEVGEGVDRDTVLARVRGYLKGAE